MGVGYQSFGLHDHQHHRGALLDVRKLVHIELKVVEQAVVNVDADQESCVDEQNGCVLILGAGVQVDVLETQRGYIDVGPQVLERLVRLLDHDGGLLV